MFSVNGHILALHDWRTEGRAIGIEGDADGALSAWIVESLGLGRCYLSDWLEHDAQTVTLWAWRRSADVVVRAGWQTRRPANRKTFQHQKTGGHEATVGADNADHGLSLLAL